jgi:hypothetical protein
LQQEGSFSALNAVRAETCKSSTQEPDCTQVSGRGIFAAQAKKTLDICNIRCSSKAIFFILFSLFDQAKNNLRAPVADNNFLVSRAFT